MKFFGLFNSALKNRNLIMILAKREIISRYQGSILGVLWAFFTPILMLCIYTFVFSVVFKARWNIAVDSKASFALTLFVGLMVFNLFAECLNRAPTLILSNPTYVKKIVFPLEILPMVTAISALFTFMVSLVIWLVFYCLLVGIPHLTILYLPIVVFPLLVTIIGVSLFLASAGVYLRDIQHLVAMLTTILMFMSPVFYPLESLPTIYQPLLLLNPLTPVIEMARNVLLLGQTPQVQFLAYSLLVSFIILFAGYAWFQKTRKGFADVI